MELLIPLSPGGRVRHYFGGEGKSEYKVGLFPVSETAFSLKDTNAPEDFKRVKYIEFIPFDGFKAGLEKLKHHKIDFLLELGAPPIDTGSAVHLPRATLLRKSSIPATSRTRDYPGPSDRKSMVEKSGTSTGFSQHTGNEYDVQCLVGGSATSWSATGKTVFSNA